MVKRDIRPVTYKEIRQKSLNTSVSSYFYPVSSAIYIDEGQIESMVVMNDRPQGGSAHHNGRIELMFNRLGITTDSLGITEPMLDYDSEGKGLNVSAIYFLSFETSKE